MPPPSAPLPIVVLPRRCAKRRSCAAVEWTQLVVGQVGFEMQASWHASAPQQLPATPYMFFQIRLLLPEDERKARIRREEIH